MKIGVIGCCSLLQDEMRDPCALIFGWLPTKDQAHLRSTCKYMVAVFQLSVHLELPTVVQNIACRDSLSVNFKSRLPSLIYDLDTLALLARGGAGNQPKASLLNPEDWEVVWYPFIPKTMSKLPPSCCIDLAVHPMIIRRPGALVDDAEFEMGKLKRLHLFASPLQPGSTLVSQTPVQNAYNDNYLYSYSSWERMIDQELHKEPLTETARRIPKTILHATLHQLHYCVEIILGDGLEFIEEIGARFLSECSRLKRVQLCGLKNVRKVGSRFLSTCCSLEIVEGLDNMNSLTEVGSGWFHQSFGTARETLELSLPRNVESVGDHFLAELKSVTEVTLKGLNRCRKIGKGFLASGNRLRVIDLSHFATDGNLHTIERELFLNNHHVTLLRLHEDTPLSLRRPDLLARHAFSLEIRRPSKIAEVPCPENRLLTHEENMDLARQREVQSYVDVSPARKVSEIASLFGSRAESVSRTEKAELLNSEAPRARASFLEDGYRTYDWCSNRQTTVTSDKPAVEQCRFYDDARRPQESYQSILAVCQARSANSATKSAQ